MKQAEVLQLLDAEIRRVKSISASDVSYDKRNACGRAYSLLHEIKREVVEGNSEVDVRLDDDPDEETGEDSYDQRRHDGALYELAKTFAALEGLGMTIYHEFDGRGRLFREVATGRLFRQDDDGIITYVDSTDTARAGPTSSSSENVHLGSQRSAVFTEGVVAK